MENGFTAQKPKTIKPIKAKNLTAIFESLGGMLLSGVTFQWSELYNNVLKFKENLSLTTEEEVAWRLIMTAMAQALFDLLDEHRQDLELSDAERLEQRIKLTNDAKRVLEDHELVFTIDFFDSPQSSNIAIEMKDILKEWLSFSPLPESKISTIVYDFPSKFVNALHKEWVERRSEYEILADYFNSPFFKAAQYERSWALYNTWLESQVNCSMFGEDFSLRDMYVALNVYYEKNYEEKNRVAHVVVDLETHLQSWLDKKNKKDTTRVICGGPGSGKSSFVKMFAFSQSKKRKVLYVPLHWMELESTFEDSITTFLKRNDWFNENPCLKEKDLLLIFDGLDELTQQGNACIEVAKDFISKVQKFMEIKNQRHCQIRVIFTGRDVAVQSNQVLFGDSDADQILYLLPFCVTETKEYTDENKLLRIDKRDIWWKKYGSKTRYGYTQLPPELKNEHMGELSVQPLLNCLIALTYFREEITFKDSTNRNDIYRDLIKQIYKRDYSFSQHKITKSISENDFIRFLEEIAICAWRGNGRTTTVEEIENHCKESGISVESIPINEISKADYSNLFLTFYFRQSGLYEEGDRAFEFTHKSFSEYLVARKIVKESQKIHNQYIQNRHEIIECLIRWIALCGKSPITSDVHRFICDEVLRASKETILNLQKTICGFIEYILSNEMPFEKLMNNRPSYKEEIRQARNAEEALLAVHSACVHYTKEPSTIRWTNETEIKNWFLRLTIQSDSYFLSYINHLDLHESKPSSGVLNETSFEKDTIRSKQLDLSKTDLNKADLRGADLRDVNLREANLRGADLRGANLRGAGLREANLREADLREADLREADLSKADLSKAGLRGANMSGAVLIRAVLKAADLYGADLIKANLNKADLNEAVLRAADLSGADLREIDSVGLDLSKADLSKADLSKASLREANMSGADLRKADLNGANLSEAVLWNAVLSGAYLGKTDLGRTSSSTSVILRGTNFKSAHISPDQLSEKQKQQALNLPF